MPPALRLPNITFVFAPPSPTESTESQKSETGYGSERPRIMIAKMTDDAEHSAFSLKLLSICRTCCGVYGNVVWSFRGTLCAGPYQNCACHLPKKSTEWLNFDFPEAVTLCRCCGSRALPSGSQWSKWFCRDCLAAVSNVNRLCGNEVIPTSRQSLLSCVDPPPVIGETLTHLPATVPQDWFERVEMLENFAQTVIRKNLSELRNGSTNSEVKIDDYLRDISLVRHDLESRVTALGRAFGLPDNLLEDALRSVKQ